MPMKPLAACALMLVLAPAAAQDAGALRTRTLAATCAGCHGTDGRALVGASVPGLAGRPAAELAELLRAFRRGERAPTVMHQIAKGYDDTQIDGLAAYFAAQR
jgi:cytochrome c553